MTSCNQVQEVDVEHRFIKRSYSSLGHERRIQSKHVLLCNLKPNFPLRIRWHKSSFTFVLVPFVYWLQKRALSGAVHGMQRINLSGIWSIEWTALASIRRWIILCQGIEFRVIKLSLVDAGLVPTRTWKNVRAKDVAIESQQFVLIVAH